MNVKFCCWACNVGNVDWYRVGSEFVKLHTSLTDLKPNNYCRREGKEFPQGT